MTGGIAEFTAALTAVYRRSPCRVLPNALWKTRQQVAAGNLALQAESDSAGATRLVARNADLLAVYWVLDAACPIPAAYLDSVSTAVLHANIAPEQVRARFATQESYFRLHNTLASLRQVGIPRGYAFTEVRPAAEAQMASDLIGGCYATLHPSVEIVLGWTRHEVYDPRLWVWVMDTARDRPAGLGIAEFDSRVGEGSLEWIQILPAYRGLGLGRALVSELLRRLPSRAAFATVGGKASGPHSPETFYRRCGFCGDDVWWVLRG